MKKFIISSILLISVLTVSQTVFLFMEESDAQLELLKTRFRENIDDLKFITRMDYLKNSIVYKSHLSIESLFNSYFGQSKTKPDALLVYDQNGKSVIAAQSFNEDILAETKAIHAFMDSFLQNEDSIEEGRIGSDQDFVYIIVPIDLDGFTDNNARGFYLAGIVDVKVLLSQFPLIERIEVSSNRIGNVLPEIEIITTAFLKEYKLYLLLYFFISLALSYFIIELFRRIRIVNATLKGISRGYVSAIPIKKSFIFAGIDRKIRALVTGFLEEQDRTKAKESEIAVLSGIVTSIQFITHDITTVFVLIEKLLNSLFSNRKFKDDKNLISLSQRLKPYIEYTHGILEELTHIKSEPSLRIEHFDLSHVLRKVRDDMNLLFSEDLSVEIEANHSAFVAADRVKIERAITNLTKNCIEASYKGRVWIKTFEDKDRILVKIGNDGSFIKESKMASLLLPFVSDKRGQINNRSGAGLGLTICKRIINAHGSELNVYSDKEKIFTEFTFLLAKCEEI